MAFEFETPQELAARLRLGREEFNQRLLTSLILEAPYPPWNTRSRPSGAGVAFLGELYGLGFGEEWGPADAVFVDELELPTRSDLEKGGAPDWAVFWPGHAWLIELKTESASHRADQIPYYCELGAHHYPHDRLDITHLTPRLQYSYAPARPGDRLAHVNWDDVIPIVRSVWATPNSPRARAVVDGVCDTLGRLNEPASAWRASLAPLATAPAAAPDPSPLDRALELARTTAADGRQRALDLEVTSLDELLALRLTTRDLVAASPADSSLRYVVPWLWRTQSGGRALTPAGARRGYELRLSRYRTDQYRPRT